MQPRRRSGCVSELASQWAGLPVRCESGNLVVLTAIVLLVGVSWLPTTALAADGPLDQSNSEPDPRFMGGMKLPPNLPGASSPPIMLPPFDPKRPQERRVAIEQLFPPLPPLPPPIHPPLGPNERPLTLNDLEN